MISVNLCVKFDIYNGAIGIVEDIIYCNDKRPLSLPVVMVEEPNYSGQSFIPKNQKQFQYFQQKKNRLQVSFFKRKQISLRLWWATAIHQCQGMTVGEWEVDRHIVIHPRTTAFEFINVGALFVAISRAKSAGKIILIPTLHGIPPSWQMHTVYSTK